MRPDPETECINVHADVRFDSFSFFYNEIIKLPRNIKKYNLIFTNFNETLIKNLFQVL